MAAGALEAPGSEVLLMTSHTERMLPGAVSVMPSMPDFVEEGVDPPTPAPATRCRSRYWRVDVAGAGAHHEALEGARPGGVDRFAVLDGEVTRRRPGAGRSA